MPGLHTAFEGARGVSGGDTGGDGVLDMGGKWGKGMLVSVSSSHRAEDVKQVPENSLGMPNSPLSNAALLPFVFALHGGRQKK